METLTLLKKEQNIAVVQNAFADFAQGNIPGILEACTDDVTWGSYDNAAVPYAKTYHGREGAGEFFATLAATVDYTRFEPREFYGDDAAVLVRGYHGATVKATGKTFGHDFLMQFRLREGKVYEFFAFVDSAEQAEAFTM